MRYARVIIVLVYVLMLDAMQAAGPRAQPGDLMITPTRIVLDGRERTAEVTLINQGTQPTTYRISFQRMRMTEEGKLEEIKDPAPAGMYADEIVRYSPRQVDLEPGESQVVRLLVRKPAGLPPGEYRSHLLFRAVPPEDAGADVEQLEGDEGGISIRLIPVYGISIPVIIRHGELAASATMSDLHLITDAGSEEPPMVRLSLSRTGDQSLYGDMLAEFKRDGETVEVGQVRGIAVYTSIDHRLVQFRLSPPEELRLKGGYLRVRYCERENSEAILAETQVYIP